MIYLKNAKVATKYQVSDPTIGKWIKAAEEGKNNLQLKKVKNKSYIIDSGGNHQILKFLSEKGSKYKNKIGYERLSPSADIYDILSESQLLELIISLKKGIFPIRYTYFGEGGRLVNRIAKFTADNYFYKNDKIRAIDSSLDYLVNRLRKYTEVNIVTIFGENSQQAVSLARKFVKSGISVTVTVLHSSQTMLDILETEMSTDYPDLPSQFLIRDIYNVNIRDILYRNNLAKPNSCNLILFLGYVLGNSEDRDIVLKNLSTSMGRHDYLIVDAEIKTNMSYQYAVEFFNEEPFEEQESWLLSLIGLSKDLVDRGVKHDITIDSMVRTYTLKKDIDIEFKIDKYKDIVSWKKGQDIKGIILHSFDLDSLVRELRESHLMVSYVSTDPEANEMLVMCEISPIDF